VLLVPFLVIALTAGGCGGSTKSPSQAAAPPTKQSTATGAKGQTSTPSLIATADPICMRLNEKLAADAQAPSGGAALVHSSQRHLALERKTLRELAKLRPSASLAPAWKEVLVYRRALAGELVTLIRYTQANDTKGIEALTASKLKLHHKLFEAATHVGFKDCALVGLGPAPTKPLRSGSTRTPA
jgi:hypothetical protein